MDSMASVPRRILLLELDIDLRLTDLWREAADVEEWNLEVASAFMRAAYGKAYVDALQEPPEDRGRLCLDHGYELPKPFASLERDAASPTLHSGHIQDFVAIQEDGSEVPVKGTRTIEQMAFKRPCIYCKGRGKVPGMKEGSEVTCPVCKGSGDEPKEKS